MNSIQRGTENRGNKRYLTSCSDVHLSKHCTRSVPGLALRRSTDSWFKETYWYGVPDSKRQGNTHVFAGRMKQIFHRSCLPHKVGSRSFFPLARCISSSHHVCFFFGAGRWHSVQGTVHEFTEPSLTRPARGLCYNYNPGILSSRFHESSPVAVSEKNRCLPANGQVYTAS